MLVKNIPPVPEGFDPDTVQFGVPPKTKICRLSVGSNVVAQWYDPIVAEWIGNHIFCLPIKPWYPPEWHDSNGNLLPDVYEYDMNSTSWPENVGPKDKIERLLLWERNNKHYSKCIVAAGLSHWVGSGVVAYRVVHRYQSS